MTFETAGGFRGHLTRVRQPIDNPQKYALDTKCRSCGADHVTRPRLVKHLRRVGSSCLHHLMDTVKPLTIQEAMVLREQDCTDTRKLATMGIPETKALIPATFSAKTRRPRREDLRVVAPVTTLQDVPPPPAPYVHRDRFYVRVVLHLFSGRRREGDFEDMMGQVAAPGRIITVSVDIINCSKRADLTDMSTIHWWLDHVRSGLVICVVCGPPMRNMVSSAVQPAK